MSIVVLSLIAVSCNKNPFVVTQINCPAVAIVSNTGNLFRFASDDRNQEDVLFSANISAINTECLQGEGVIETVEFNISVRRGPQLGSEEVIIPYFVALMRDNNLITAKRIYEVKVRFAQGEDFVTIRETIVQAFEEVDIARRYDYELLVGFQLTADELAFNVLH